MTSEDLSAALRYLQLSESDLADVTGERLDLCHAWLSGTAPIPRWLDCLLHSWCEHPQTLEVALEDLGARIAETALLETAGRLAALQTTELGARPTAN